MNCENHKEEYISYVAGGLFGDFIHQISVIKEKYMLTGKKGILYISNNGDPFRLGLENTFNKTYNLISSQDYIKDYKIYNGEHYDINLSSWRCNRFLYHDNWYIIFSDEYSIEWGKHQWLTVLKDSRWANKIVINEPTYRCSTIDYKKLHDIYGEQLVFIAFKDPNYSDYESFVQKTGLQIEYYDPVTMDELALVINSCKLFVGVPTGIMTIAFALKVPILLGRPPCNSEYAMVKTLPNHFSNITIENSE
jgi:hypothetical protein